MQAKERSVVLNEAQQQVVNELDRNIVLLASAGTGKTLLTYDIAKELRNKGKKLGNPKNLTYEAQKQGAEAMKNKALNNENNRKATALIVSLRETGKSYAKIAQQLNDNGFKTSRGYNFSASQVLILYDRYVNSLAK